ncbi:MAG: hypothetical protein ACXWDO_10400 [Bacteroidia bacterium]
MNKVTELENIITNTEDNLSIDAEQVGERLDSIKLILNYLQEHKHDSGDVETKGAMVRYLGIQKNYQTYIELYPVLLFDLDKYKTFVAKLKQDAQQGSISDKDFDRQYEALKTKLQTIDKKAAALSYNTYAVQGDYRRSHEKVKQLYEQVKMRNEGNSIKN